MGEAGGALRVPSRAVVRWHARWLILTTGFIPRGWVQFSGRHRRHHAKIVRDILRAGNASRLDSPAGL